MQRKIYLALVVIITLLGSGCTFVDNDQVAVDPNHSLMLDPDHTIGQTFVTQHGGLSGVEIWLEPEPNAQGVITLRLREDFDASVDIAVIELPLQAGSGAGFYRFAWSPQSWSQGTYRYVFLAFSGNGSIVVGAAPGEKYVNGAAYRDHKPIDTHQLSFRLVYDFWGATIDLLKWLVRALFWIGSALLLFLLPGYVLLTHLDLNELPTLGRLALAIGFSVVIYPLLMLWTYVAGLRLDYLHAYLPVAIGLMTLAFMSLRKLKKVLSNESACLKNQIAPNFDLLSLFTSVIVLLIFLSRLMVIRPLAAPMWGDSYQHSLITQLIVDNGGLFSSWEPYVPLSTFTYHFGFHALMASFAWITGLEPFRAVLIGAQIVNAFAVISLYPLAWQISKSRFAAALSLLIAGLVLPMPAYYVNWGRYTQLAGQVILPAFIFMVMKLGESEEWSRRRLYAIGTPLLLAGLLLTHYRVAVWALAFVVAAVVSVFLLKRSNLLAVTANALRVSLFALLLTIPWWLIVTRGNLFTILSGFLSVSPSQVGDFIREYNSMGDLSFYMPTVVWWLLIASIAYGLLRKNRAVFTLLLWILLLFLIANPDKIGLPGSGAITNFAILIASYMVVAPLVSYLIAALVEQLNANSRVAAVIDGATIALLAVGSIAAFSSQLNIVDPRFMLVTYPDLKAMHWVEKQTPRNSLFLVDSFLAYGETAVVGSDAGWWIPLLSKRANTVPPLVYVGERMDETYKSQLEDIFATSRDPAVNLAHLFPEGQVGFVYIGQLNQRRKGGLFDQVYRRFDEFEEVYTRDRVVILKPR